MYDNYRNLDSCCTSEDIEPYTSIPVSHNIEIYGCPYCETAISHSGENQRVAELYLNHLSTSCPESPTQNRHRDPTLI